MPDWVRVMSAAKTMGVAPWDLMRQKEHDQWVAWALFLQQVTNEAQEKAVKAAREGTSPSG